MSVYIFTGPTLAADEARLELDAVYLPPASQGDVYRVSLRRPPAIGIIDGYFERVPAVWHKEILWAMAQGIHVFGSASMGALRAAELSAFGMEGVGAIFEAYRDGVLRDDDEVAVAHGPAAAGYRLQSEAMVNIRRTLANAVQLQVISSTTQALLEAVAKALFYPDRTFPDILRRALEEGAPAAEIDALRAWLPTGRVDLKRLDALAMLRLMRERLAAGLTLKHVHYTFEYTDAWDMVVRQGGDLAPEADDADTVAFERLLDELRLEGDAYARALEGALLRVVAGETTRQRGVAVPRGAVHARAADFRRQRGIIARAQAARWLREHDLDAERFRRLMEDEERLNLLKEMLEPEAVVRIPDYLRVTGAYTRLLARAREKQHALQARGLTNAALTDAGMSEDELLRWYFETRLSRPVTDDPPGYARSLGFPDLGAFTRALLREFWHVTPQA